MLGAVRAGGRVDLLLHAAGLEVSRRLADKPQPEFDRVFDVKADGWFNLLAALGPTPIAAAAVFSSIAGRFGNAGQTDYAAANELLAKSVSDLVRRRPGCRGLVLDWTGWAGIGMASRGSIPKLLEAAGIDLLRPDLGIPILRRELADARRLPRAGRRRPARRHARGAPTPAAASTPPRSPAGAPRPGRWSARSPVSACTAVSRSPPVSIPRPSPSSTTIASTARRCCRG